eukprot:tig00020531_g10035.t1
MPPAGHSKPLRRRTPITWRCDLRSHNLSQQSARSPQLLPMRSTQKKIKIALPAPAHRMRRPAARPFLDLPSVDMYLPLLQKYIEFFSPVQGNYGTEFGTLSRNAFDKRFQQTGTAFLQTNFASMSGKGAHEKRNLAAAKANSARYGELGAHFLSKYFAFMLAPTNDDIFPLHAETPSVESEGRVIYFKDIGAGTNHVSCKLALYYTLFERYPPKQGAKTPFRCLKATLARASGLELYGNSFREDAQLLDTKLVDSMSYFAATLGGYYDDVRVKAILSTVLQFNKGDAVEDDYSRDTDILFNDYAWDPAPRLSTLKRISDSFPRHKS